jgi:fructose-1,6-bisphosphatase I
MPTKLHQRTPLVIGSAEDVALVESFIRDRDRRDPHNPHNTES